MQMEERGQVREREERCRAPEHFRVPAVLLESQVPEKQSPQGQ